MDPNKQYIVEKGIYDRVRVYIDIRNIFCFRNLMIDFYKTADTFHFLKFEKNSKLQQTNNLYIIRKGLIRRKRIYACFTK